jgi:hypothetical protein
MLLCVARFAPTTNVLSGSVAAELSLDAGRGLGLSLVSCDRGFDLGLEQVRCDPIPPLVPLPSNGVPPELGLYSGGRG